jgi:hypothetical protein
MLQLNPGKTAEARRRPLPGAPRSCCRCSRCPAREVYPGQAHTAVPSAAADPGSADGLIVFRGGAGDAQRVTGKPSRMARVRHCEALPPPCAAEASGLPEAENPPAGRCLSLKPCSNLPVEAASPVEAVPAGGPFSRGPSWSRAPSA